MIPNIFHFIFGMAEDFGGKPFSLVHYLSIKSAIEVNKPEVAFFYYQFEPQGEWWDKAKPLLNLQKIVAPDSFMGKKLYHVAHKADVVRLQALQKHGGIYLDLDTICVKPLQPFFNNSFAIGEEKKAAYVPKNFRQRIKYNFRRRLGLLKEKSTAPTGLCNAVLLSEKNSAFINDWLNEYKTFRSKGRDKYWNEHSVKVPEKLAARYPEKLTILGPYVFHYPLYKESDLKMMFEEVHEFPQACVHHLWESFSWNKYLSKLTIEKIKTENTTYNLIARRFL
ncbi:MAG TPA: glycosyltransferase [Chitinophagaceae bacterium]|nr:glycosyltransferase [Chitinophagaceae bacterium]